MAYPAKPTVGGDEDAWGTKLNTLLDALETAIDAATTTADAALPLAGGVLTGNVQVNRDTYDAVAVESAGAAPAVFTLDLDTGRYFHFTVEANSQIAFLHVPLAGQAVFVVLEITDGGAFTFDWTSVVKWPQGSTPSMTASGVDIVTLFTRDGGVTWHASLGILDSR